MQFLKKRLAESRKGDHGRVLIIGGSNKYTGAPALAALAALRTGVDIVTVAAPEQAAWIINTYSPDLITRKFEGEFFNWDNVKDVIDLTENFDAVLIGPGLGTEPDTLAFAKEVIERIPNPKVIDADALKAIRINESEIHHAILTPHAKEFEIMTDETLPKEKEDKINMLKHFARNDNVILLKGHTDIIINKNKLKLNKTGNPGMTVGGTGDILAGLCAGFLAQTKDLFNSAYYAANLNGKIGDDLLKTKGYNFTASDFIPLIPEIMKKINKL
ncbi:NAD(P)H-hydrate dehydratase [Candidatus Woesearchaeota archaeon]|nr:NAD(P)H-hydrate dehydratase [Candidatus Woesearchaeota archaeon]